MSYKILTSIDIDAPADSVWKHLTDFEKYGSWNPFIKSIKGHVAEGNIIEVTIDGMKFKPKVLIYDAPSQFKWKGVLGSSFIFAGEHNFEIRERGADHCTLVHSEKFQGLLLPLMKKKLQTETRQGFEAMNRAIKARAEESDLHAVPE